MTRFKLMRKFYKAIAVFIAVLEFCHMQMKLIQTPSDFGQLDQHSGKVFESRRSSMPHLSKAD